MIKLKILVVLYNKLPIESQTLNSFIKFKEKLSKFSELIIWDNSDKYLNSSQLAVIKDIFLPLQFEYKANGINTSLSKIYNNVIRTINEDEFLVIFDHDSTVELSYFINLIDSINANPDINLFLPIVNCNNQIVSPANLWYFKGSYWKIAKYGKIYTKGITAINSGMVMNGKYLKTKFVGYDEDLKFYETDNDFMNKYSEDNDFLYVVDSHINHSLSIYEESSLNDKLFRYHSAKDGCLIHLKKRNLVIYVIALLYYFALSIKYAIKYHSFRFLINKTK